MDDIFLLPSTPVAMPRAYWNLPHQKSLTSMLILIEPSDLEGARLMAAVETMDSRKDEFDMEILNSLYGDSAMVLPHRRYGLLSGEFRSNDHGYYLGNPYERWDPDKVIQEAHLVHYSDWPIPKPWIMWPRNLLQETGPKCEITQRAEDKIQCRNKEIWYELYNDFRRRRKV